MLACPVCQLAYRQHVIDIYSSMIDLSDFELKPECTIKILTCQFLSSIICTTQKYSLFYVIRTKAMILIDKERTS